MNTAMKILVVDDDADFCTLMNRCLQQAGCQVETASTAKSAEERFVPPFDLVLLDMRLPDKPGTEVLKKIRRYSPTLPVLILSGWYKQPDGIEADPFTFFSEKLSSLEALCQIINHHVAHVKRTKEFP